MELKDPVPNLKPSQRQCLSIAKPKKIIKEDQKSNQTITFHAIAYFDCVIITTGFTFESCSATSSFTSVLFLCLRAPKDRKWNRNCLCRFVLSLPLTHSLFAFPYFNNYYYFCWQPPSMPKQNNNNKNKNKKTTAKAKTTTTTSMVEITTKNKKND